MNVHRHTFKMNQSYKIEEIMNILGKLYSFEEQMTIEKLQYD